ncbi:MAG TPA: alpha/beta hydrolase-fold protein [Candidatus Sulfotelmatobacter sp.]|nr:alpha/beta hydrolase-fold protein [Candidatus Sulfotelmatobacter sp.]
MNDLSLLLGLRGQVSIDRVDSPALRDNPLGDPSVRPLAVYTPPGYDAQGSGAYPVLYCLHGYGGDVAALVSSRPWETNVLQWADQLIAQGAMPPAIVAIVDGFTRLGGSQYVDSVHNGAYATYVVRDVIGHVDARYRTLARAGGRGVFGKSSGGFGALHLSLAYPGVFAAFASHSGDAYFPYCYQMEWPVAMMTLEQHGGSIAAFMEAYEGRNKRPHAFMATVNQLGMSAAYSPRAAERWAIDLPWDPRTGEMRADVFARWLAFDPVERVAASRDALAAMRLRYLDCGTRDEYGLYVGARVFAQRCRDHGLAVRHEEFDDDHRNVGYRYAISLPALAGALDRAG